MTRGLCFRKISRQRGARWAPSRIAGGVRGASPERPELSWRRGVSVFGSPLFLGRPWGRIHHMGVWGAGCALRKHLPLSGRHRDGCASPQRGRKRARLAGWREAPPGLTHRRPNGRPWAQAFGVRGSTQSPRGGAAAFGLGRGLPRVPRTEPTAGCTPRSPVETGAPPAALAAAPGPANAITRDDISSDWRCLFVFLLLNSLICPNMPIACVSSHPRSRPISRFLPPRPPRACVSHRN